MPGNHQFSRNIFFGCCLFIFLTGIFYYPKWNQKGTEATISWDVAGYYIYLPAVFIYKDIKQLGFHQAILEKYGPTPDFQQASIHQPSGNYVIKYSSGQAVLFLPFFLAGHLAAELSRVYPADGYSFPYQLSIGIGMLLYALLGLYTLRKILLNYFDDRTTAITILGIALATNYLDYAAINGAMTHNTLFTIYCLLIFLTIKFYRQVANLQNLKTRSRYNQSVLAVAIGGLVGLATLIRPTEIISCIIPLLWGLENIQGLKERIRFLLKNFKLVLVALAAGAMIISIQLVYWKIVSGEWLVYSYGEEGFDWLSPHIKDGLFSYKSGWLVYSPFMILSLAGFFMLYRKRKDLFWVSFIFSSLFIYLCFAWQTWWYGGALGQRAMVQAYPVLSFPLASMIAYLISKKLTRIFTICFLILCIFYNLWWTHQAHKGGLFRAGEMTGAYFWKVLGRTAVDERVHTLLDNNYLFEEQPVDPLKIYVNDFEQDTSRNMIASPSGVGRSIVLNKELQFSNEYFFSLNASERKKIRAAADFTATVKEWETWKMTQFVIKFYNVNELIRTNQVRVFRILSDHEQKRILIDAIIPDKATRASILFWNSGSEKSIYIDNLEVICFR